MPDHWPVTPRVAVLECGLHIRLITVVKTVRRTGPSSELAGLSDGRAWSDRYPCAWCIRRVG